MNRMQAESVFSLKILLKYSVFLGSTRSFAAGFRGRPPVDKRAGKELLLTVSEIVGSYGDIQEIDLNPVIGHEKGLSIADARIILQKDKKANNW